MKFIVLLLLAIGMIGSVFGQGFQILEMNPPPSAGQRPRQRGESCLSTMNPYGSNGQYKIALGNPFILTVSLETQTTGIFTANLDDVNNTQLAMVEFTEGGDSLKYITITVPLTYEPSNDYPSISLSFSASLSGGRCLDFIIDPNTPTATPSSSSTTSSPSSSSSSTTQTSSACLSVSFSAVAFILALLLVVL